jgi:hypothetical protein
MPDWPDEYTVKTWRSDDTEEFVGFYRLIETAGVVEPWPPPPADPVYHNRYLVIGEHKYCAIGLWATGTRWRRRPSSTGRVHSRHWR